MGYAAVSIVHHDWSWNEFETTKIYKVTWTLGGFLFLNNHWLFTSHYLKVACLFKFSFSQNLENAIIIMQRRRKLLLILDIVVYGFLISMTAALLMFSERDDWIVAFCSLWTFVLSLMAPINLLSMRYILKISRPLERHGIYENVLIMRLYGLFWIVSLVSMIVELTLLMIFEKDNALSSDTNIKFEIAFEALSLINYGFLFGLDILILITFFRFSLKLDLSTIKKIKRTLQQEFDHNTQANVANSRQFICNERDAAVRRLATYRKLADE